TGNRNRVSYSGPLRTHFPSLLPGPGIQYAQRRPEEGVRHAVRADDQIISCENGAPRCSKAPFPVFPYLELGREPPRDCVINKQIGWVRSFWVFQSVPLENLEMSERRE